MLRVSMVRIELCSTRTIGRSACRGIVACVRLNIRGVGMTVVRGCRSAQVGDGEVAIASTGMVAEQRDAGVVTVVANAWINVW